MSAVREEIADLRALLREKFGGGQVFSGQPRERFATGVGCLDEVGVCRGAISEIVAGRGSTGVGWLIDHLITGAEDSHHLALVDGADSFDPSALGAGGNRRFLWVRCRAAQDAVKAAEMLLRDGNLPLVMLDLQLDGAGEARRIPHGLWYRLRTTAEDTGAALLVFAAQKLVPCAVTRLVLQQRFSLSVLDELRADVGIHPVVAKAEPQIGATDIAEVETVDVAAAAACGNGDGRGTDLHLAKAS